MAPKLSTSIDDPRLPSAGCGTPVPQPPTGAASEMGPGVLKANGPLEPGGNTMTIAGGANFSRVGKPTANKGGR
jgi:hypothetical protein